MEMTLGEIAKVIGAELHGDPGLVIRGICDWKWVKEGGADLLAFQTRSVTDKGFLDSEVRAVIVPFLPEAAFLEGKNYLVVRDTRYAFAEIGGMFNPLPRATETRIHETAVIDESALLEDPVEIGPFCVVGPGARIQKGCVLESHVHVDADCNIGEDTVLEPFVAVLRGSQLGKRNHIGTGAKIGVAGFGNAKKDGVFLRTPQIGIVVIDDDVHIGANTCVDRATLGETQIGAGVRLDNLIQIAHNCSIGAHTGIAALTGCSGSTHIGEYCLIGGQVGFGGHQKVVDRSVIMGQSGVYSDLEQPGVYFGTPIRPVKETHRISVAMGKLPDLIRRVRALESKLAPED